MRLKIVGRRSIQNLKIRFNTRNFNSSSVFCHNVPPKLTSTSQDEMTHFNALASSWWDVDGPQRILHKMNFLRMDFITETVKAHIKLNYGNTDQEDSVYIPPYNPNLLPEPIREAILAEQDIRRDELLSENKLTVLDVGCGGGILSESMARLTYVKSVLGIDLSKDVLEAAKLHSRRDPIFTENPNKLKYELSAIEDLPSENQYDIVTMFEMLEHVDYPSNVLSEALKRVKVGGWVFISTINRDFISWFTTIFMGEHLLRIVPVGTHTLDKYINQHEIKDWMENNDEIKDSFTIVDSKGCIYIPAYGWKFTNSANVGNYFMAIRRNK